MSCLLDKLLTFGHSSSLPLSSSDTWPSDYWLLTIWALEISSSFSIIVTTSSSVYRFGIAIREARMNWKLTAFKAFFHEKKFEFWSLQ
jgi:hypothetical protein